MKIAIVGAGIMGRTLAYFLVKNNFDVSLFDQGSMEEPTNCSYFAAGMLSPFTELHVALPSLIDVGLSAINIWRDSIKELGSDIFFNDKGTLVVAYSKTRQELSRIKETLANKNSLAYKEFNTNEMEPEINSSFKHSLLLPFEAQVCAKTLMQALLNYLTEKGCLLFGRTFVSKISQYSIHVNDKIINYDWVIDCRGLGAKNVFPSLRGVRGELIEVYAPQVKLQYVIKILNPHRPLYVIPRPNHRYLIGASSIDSESMAPITLRSALELLSDALWLHKGFMESHVVSMNVHCRPALETNLPILAISNKEKRIRINGLYRYGYMFSPVFAKAVVNYFKSNEWDNFLQNFIVYE